MSHPNEIVYEHPLLNSSLYVLVSVARERFQSAQIHQHVDNESSRIYAITFLHWKFGMHRWYAVCV